MTIWMRTLGTSLGALVASATLLLAPASAQTPYPARPIKLIVPFGTGSGIDVVARKLGEELSARLKVPVVIENREGAGGTIGATVVAHSAADGYTLLFAANPPFAIGPALLKNDAYKAADDFVAVARVAATPMLLVASPKAPFRNFRDMASYVRAHPGEVNFATAGIGTPSHLGIAILEKNLDARLQTVHYKSVNQATQDTISGQVQLYMAALPAAIGQLSSDQFVPLAMGSPARNAAYPAIPTLAEALGRKDVELVVWYGLLGPRGLDPRIVKTLEGEVQKAVPSMSQFLSKQGIDPAYENSEAFSRRVRADLKSGLDQLSDLGVQ